MKHENRTVVYQSALSMFTTNMTTHEKASRKYRDDCLKRSHYMCLKVMLLYQ